MSEKKTMQIAKSNCTITCGRCGSDFKSKYGILDGEIYCPRCYNMYIEKSIADVKLTMNIRKERTIFRVICFVISVACIVFAIISKSKFDSLLQFVIPLVFGIVIGITPFYKDFCAFVARGFNGFVKTETTVHRQSVIYYRNGIIEDNTTGFFRIVFYFVDFLLVWPCLVLLYIAVPVRAIIDLVRIGKAKKILREGFNKMLPPENEKPNDKYNFDVRFINSYDSICIKFFMNWKKVKEEEAIEALEKNLVYPLIHKVNYKDGYAEFLDYYYGRRDYDGKRFVFLDVTLDDPENSIFVKDKKQKRRNK